MRHFSTFDIKQAKVEIDLDEIAIFVFPDNSFVSLEPAQCIVYVRGSGVNFITSANEGQRILTSWKQGVIQ